MVSLVQYAPGEGFGGILCFLREVNPFFSSENPVKTYSK